MNVIQLSIDDARLACWALVLDFDPAQNAAFVEAVGAGVHLYNVRREFGKTDTANVVFALDWAKELRFVFSNTSNRAPHHRVCVDLIMYFILVA